MTRRRKPATPYFHLTARLNLKHEDQARAAKYMREWFANSQKANPDYSQKDLLVDMVLTLANEYGKPTRRDMVTRLALMMEDKLARFAETLQMTTPRPTMWTSTICKTSRSSECNRGGYGHPIMEADMNDYERKVIEAKTLCYELLGMAFPEKPNRPNTTLMNKTESDRDLQHVIEWLDRIERRIDNGKS